MWVEATCDYQNKTTRARVLIQQITLPFAAALPKAVTYSDTGIKLEEYSDIYAVNADGTPDNSGAPFVTAISAGGTWTPSMSSMVPSRAEVGRFTLNSTSNLAAPGSNTQSLGIRANGSAGVPNTYATSAPTHTLTAGGRTYSDVTIAPETIGFLSDYFDQAAQASLANEAQAGKTPATAPTAPTSWSYDAGTWTQIDSTLLTTIQAGSYTATADLYQTAATNGGNMTLSSSSARTYAFRNLYVAGNLTITGRITFSATSLYVGGTLTITGPTSSTVTDTITNTLYVNGTGTSTIYDRVNLSAAAVYCRGSLSLNNRTSTTVTHTIPQIYVALDFTVPVGGSSPSSTALVTLDVASSLYAGRNITLNGPSSGTITDTFGLIYASGAGSTSVTTLRFAGNVIVKATGVTAYGDFTISGASSAIKDWLGQVYVNAISSTSDPTKNRGTIQWSGTASVTSRDYTLQADPNSEAAQPKPMWLGRKFTRSGTYADEYGNVWVPGNSTDSVIFQSTGASSVLCVLLCTTEKTTTSGNITFGSRTRPMVYFFMCDNNGIYPQVVDWQSTGTYYGLMVINESTIRFSGQTNSSIRTVEGAVFAGCPYDPTVTTTMSQSDIVLQDYCSIAYNQTVVGSISTSSLKTTTTVTQTVPGSWQQLPVD